jgi:PAS domain S-box-containing protein
MSDSPDRGLRLTSVVSMEELKRRPSRPSDFAAENRALIDLARDMAASPGEILQRLVETALDLCRAHSAGISLLEDGDQKRNFHWRAIAGEWSQHRGGGTPRDFGPCGTVLDYNAPLLFSHPERDFPYFGEVRPLLEEGLLIPFHVDGEAIGTIWVVAHDASRRFDSEDLRVMTHLGAFAGAAYQTFTLLGATRTANDELQLASAAAQRLAAIVESSDDAIVSKDLNGIIASWNAGAERLFGYTAEEVVGKPITLLLPSDRQEEEALILGRIRRGERVDHFDTVRRRKDGSLVEISLTVSPVRTVGGGIIGASKIARDITERRRAQDQQNLLIREMGHRVKNLFAVTSGIVSLSARSAATPGDMAAAIQGRLAALARAHELTRPGLIEDHSTGRTDTTLRALIRTILSPYADPTRGVQEIIAVSGADMPIRGQAITSFALMLHELATNAAKYGALSSPEGHVEIECSLEGEALVLDWRERGGPNLDGPPPGEGFGGLLIRRVVTGQLAGRLSYDWRAEGLAIRLWLPVERLSA